MNIINDYTNSWQERLILYERICEYLTITLKNHRLNPNSDAN